MKLGDFQNAWCVRCCNAPCGCAKIPPVIAKTNEERKFDSGATRSGTADRYDPEAALCPRVLERYCAYVHSCNRLADGSVRTDDNWQSGIPLPVYMKGMWRHFLHAWARHRGASVQDPQAAKAIEDDLCALIFNAQGYLHELLKAGQK